MPLKNRKLIVTGGPTREWLDPVRFISNPSTGKMGAALAGAGFPRCGETVFIHGPVDNSLYAGKPYRSVGVETTRDMLDAVLAELEKNCLLIMAAAPVDYAPLAVSRTKIKKEGDAISIAFKKTPDILKNVARRAFEGIFTVGFAAETNNVEEYALGKLRDKNLDMICLNDVSQSGAGFAIDTNIISIYCRDSSTLTLPMLPKTEAAERIFDRIEEYVKKYLDPCLRQL